MNVLALQVLLVHVCVLLISTSASSNLAVIATKDDEAAKSNGWSLRGSSSDLHRIMKKDDDGNEKDEKNNKKDKKCKGKDCEVETQAADPIVVPVAAAEEEEGAIDDADGSEEQPAFEEEGGKEESTVDDTTDTSSSPIVLVEEDDEKESTVDDTTDTSSPVVLVEEDDEEESNADEATASPVILVEEEEDIEEESSTMDEATASPDVLVEEQEDDANTAPPVDTPTGTIETGEDVDAESEAAVAQTEDEASTINLEEAEEQVATVEELESLEVEEETSQPVAKPSVDKGEENKAVLLPVDEEDTISSMNGNMNYITGSSSNIVRNDPNVITVEDNFPGPIQSGTAASQSNKQSQSTMDGGGLNATGAALLSVSVASIFAAIFAFFIIRRKRNAVDGETPYSPSKDDSFFVDRDESTDITPATSTDGGSPIAAEQMSTCRALVLVDPEEAATFDHAEASAQHQGVANMVAPENPNKHLSVNEFNSDICSLNCVDDLGSIVTSSLQAISSPDPPASGENSFVPYPRTHDELARKYKSENTVMM